MNYECKLCEYVTKYNSNFKKHQQSNVHISNVLISKNNSNICNYCDRTFASPSSLAKHDKACARKNKIQLDNEKLQINEKHYVGIIDEKNDMIAQLKSENAHLKEIVKTAEKIVTTSVSAMSYALKNYNDAPVLKTIEHCEDVNRKKDDRQKFVKILAYEYKNKHLDAYIGDYIIETYKKDDPADQSIWNSDTNRMTYLIRDIIANNKVDWKIDKKGVKTNELLVAPLVDHIDKEIREHMSTLKIDYTSEMRIREAMELINHTSAITKSIEMNSLNKDVLKYIAPYFYLNKNDDVKTIEE
jgi:hypothetical protein